MTLDVLKNRLGISESISVYDDELRALLSAAEKDITAAGVPSALVTSDDQRVQLCITAFVKSHYGDDRQNSQRYTTIYREMVFRLCQEPEEV